MSHNGFLGLEMPFLGIPTIICDYKGLTSIEGGCITINNKQDYFDKLDNMGDVIETFHHNYKNHYDNIIRYAYWYLYEDVLRVRSFSYNVPNRFDLMQLKKEDLTLNQILLDLFN